MTSWMEPSGRVSVLTPAWFSSSEMVKPGSTVSGGQAAAHSSTQAVLVWVSSVNAYRVWPFAPTITSPRLPTVARSTTGPAGAAAGAGSGAGAGAGSAAGACVETAASPLISV